MENLIKQLPRDTNPIVNIYNVQGTLVDKYYKTDSGQIIQYLTIQDYRGYVYKVISYDLDWLVKHEVVLFYKGKKILEFIDECDTLNHKRVIISKVRSVKLPDGSYKFIFTRYK